MGSGFALEDGEHEIDLERKGERDEGDYDSCGPNHSLEPVVLSESEPCSDEEVHCLHRIR